MFKKPSKTMFRKGATLAGTAALLLLQAAAQAEPAKGPDKGLVERGRYLVKIAGCNDCHTPGYLQSGGKVDEKLWLTGDGFGWRGPWGTTYGINLRLYAQNMTPQQWLDRVATMQPRPPMPAFNLKAMSQRDLLAIHAYLKAMGPAGQPAPAWVPPDRQPPQPYAQFPG
jgi:mono/diheme cytochrome c family protein